LIRLIHIGQVVDAEWINRQIQRYGRKERRAYADMNAQLHTRSAFQLPPPTEAHGSMVMDAAFGAEPEDAMARVPILAVQLPPEAAEDTSGTVSESYIVQGVRWILHQARNLSAHPDVKVVLNISYGVLAGQKDGGKFLEAQIAKEIETAALYCQHVEVVFAYGNSGNSRQVADLTVAAGQMQEMTWLVQGGNAAPAFVEIRAVENQSGDLRLTDLPRDLQVELIPPSGLRTATIVTGTSGTSGIEAAPNVTKFGGTGEVRLYNIPPRSRAGRPDQPGYALAAIAPTRRGRRGLPQAQAGDWKIRLVNNSGADIRVVLQIQRGDTAPGFRSQGRQTRFEGGMERLIQDGFAKTQPVPPLTNAGTSSAYANGAAFRTVGALQHLFGTTRPAPYSAEGADWTPKKLHKFAEVVDGLATAGVRTSGAYSGTWVRLSGTSAAAALHSRQFVESLL
jgi:hypothetical protein